MQRRSWSWKYRAVRSKKNLLASEPAVMDTSPNLVLADWWRTSCYQVSRKGRDPNTRTETLERCFDHQLPLQCLTGWGLRCIQVEACQSKSLCLLDLCFKTNPLSKQASWRSHENRFGPWDVQHLPCIRSLGAFETSPKHHRRDLHFLHDRGLISNISSCLGDMCRATNWRTSAVKVMTLASAISRRLRTSLATPYVVLTTHLGCHSKGQQHGVS